jgi:VanZ family protein
MIKRNIFSIIIALVILFLSFARSETFSGVNVLGIPHIDKLVHLSMYFGLMMVLLFENRSEIKSTRSLFVFAIIPLIFGTLIEFFQSWLTETRSGDIFDGIFNLCGILLAVGAWWVLRKFVKKENQI